MFAFEQYTERKHLLILAVLLNLTPFLRIIILYSGQRRKRNSQVDTQQLLSRHAISLFK